MPGHPDEVLLLSTARARGNHCSFECPWFDRWRCWYSKGECLVEDDEHEQPLRTVRCLAAEGFAGRRLRLPESGW